MGIQICDQLGRVHLIIPSPVGERYPSNVTFNGKTLYATCGDKVFCRAVKLEGAQAWAAPVKPAKHGSDGIPLSPPIRIVVQFSPSEFGRGGFL